jgi:putative membrane protein
MHSDFTFRKIDHNRYLLYLGILFLFWWLVLAISPYSREDWMLENVLVLVAVLAIAATYRQFPLSRLSYTLIFLFLCLHEIGAHYTYSQTPYDRWFQHYLGFSLNDLLGFHRNQFDRLAHFAYGFLLAYPIREMFIRIVAVRGFWGYFLPLDLTLSTSALFELFEWLAAELVGGDLGTAYLGLQGDVWDAQKDMLVAAIGALLAMLITAVININLQRDFAQEWNDSLKVKGKYPLGEYAIMKMLRGKNNK